MTVHWPTPTPRWRDIAVPSSLALSTTWLVLCAVLLGGPDPAARPLVLMFAPSAACLVARVHLMLTRDRDDSDGVLYEGSLWLPTDLLLVHLLLWCEGANVLAVLALAGALLGGPGWIGTAGFLGILVAWCLQCVTNHRVLAAMARYDVEEVSRLASYRLQPVVRRGMGAWLALMRGDPKTYAAQLDEPERTAFLAEHGGAVPEDPIAAPWPPRYDGTLAGHVDGLLHQPFLAGRHEEVLRRWEVLAPYVGRLGRGQRDATVLTVVAALCALGRKDEAVRLALTVRSDPNADWLRRVAPTTYAALAPLRAAAP